MSATCIHQAHSQILNHLAKPGIELHPHRYLVSFLNFTAQETESGFGIMEEPELTMISTSDISTAEMGFADLTLEEKENEAKNCFQVSFTALINIPHVYSNS